MRSSKFQQVLSAALESLQGFGFAVARVELRALTITGRKVAMPSAFIADNRHASCLAPRRAAMAVWRACREAVGHLPGVIAVSLGHPRSVTAKTCVS
jgi:hypothetical protein